MFSSRSTCAAAAAAAAEAAGSYARELCPSCHKAVVGTCVCTQEAASEAAEAAGTLL